MVHAYQKGELENPSDEIKDIAKSISKKDAEDFAETKHKGLPNKVKKTKKVTESQLRQMVREELMKVQLPTEDRFENNGIDWPEDDGSEEDQVIEMLTSLSSNGQAMFADMYDELTTHPYILKNSERFRGVTEKIKNLCDQIEDIWTDWE
jgi:hypothetical protein